MPRFLGQDWVSQSSFETKTFAQTKFCSANSTVKYIWRTVPSDLALNSCPDFRVLSVLKCRSSFKVGMYFHMFSQRRHAVNVRQSYITKVMEKQSASKDTQNRKMQHQLTWHIQQVVLQYLVHVLSKMVNTSRTQVLCQRCVRNHFCLCKQSAQNK